MYAWLDLLWVTRSFRMFILYYIGDAIINLAAVGGMLLVAERFDGIGPWTKWQIVFMLGYGTLVTGLLGTFFGYNVLFIGRRLGRGQFDHTLIQPQPVWMALLTDGFNPFGSSSTVFCGLALLLWASLHVALPATPLWYALLLLNLAASTVVVLAFNFFWGSLAFWAPRAAEEINSPLVHMVDQLKAFPLDGLSGALLGGMLSIVPAGFVAWYPCRYLLGIDASPLAAGLTPLAALALGALAVLMFAKGKLYYGRTGSQRYRAMGHRG
jgi:ABC-2 type transport system permease protein